jgi:capsular polysaccharide transport system permease protein
MTNPVDIVTLPPPAPPFWRRVLRRLDGKFIGTVVVPTTVALLYYGLIASDVYISESRFVIRSPQHSAAPSGLSAILSGTGLSSSHDDAFTVNSYVLSRDALAELDTSTKYRQAYSANTVDVFNRFPGISWDRSDEALYQYYLKYVEIAYDNASSITTLNIRAFNPDQAKSINEALLQMSERLVNNLNNRSRHDLIDVAQREVDVAAARSKEAALALSAFRSRGEVFDPARESATQLDNVERLREELRSVEAQVARLTQLAPMNPQLASLKSQAQALRDTIAKSSARVLGTSGASLSSKDSIFERLSLDKDFADKQLAAAMAALDSARNEAARKQLYLERLVQPNRPDTALEPRRARSVLTVFLIGMIAWGVLSLLVAGVREHMD